MEFNEGPVCAPDMNQHKLHDDPAMGTCNKRRRWRVPAQLALFCLLGLLVAGLAGCGERAEAAEVDRPVEEVVVTASASPILMPAVQAGPSSPIATPVMTPVAPPAVQPQSAATAVARAAARARFNFGAPEAPIVEAPDVEGEEVESSEDIGRLLSGLLELSLPEIPAEQVEETDSPQPEVDGGMGVDVDVKEASLPALTPTPVWSFTPDETARTVRVPIFMYHYLSEPPRDANIYRQDLSVAPDRFAAHLDALQANGYTTISFYQLYAHLVEGTPLPEKPVILSFDDGYRDNYENAFPLLRARGMTATFFIVTDFIDDQLPAYLTWDMVREMYAGGMSIESHGRNHVSLKNRDVDYLVWQALGSLETIEAELGVRPRFIAYPAGEYDSLTIDIFASAHYLAGVTTVQGATHTRDRLFELRRVRVRNTTTAQELLRLAALDW